MFSRSSLFMILITKEDSHMNINIYKLVRHTPYTQKLQSLNYFINNKNESFIFIFIYVFK